MEEVGKRKILQLGGHPPHDHIAVDSFEPSTEPILESLGIYAYCLAFAEANEGVS